MRKSRSRAFGGAVDCCQSDAASERTKPPSLQCREGMSSLPVSRPHDPVANESGREVTPVFMRLNTVILGGALLILLAMVALAYREWRQYTLARVSGFRTLAVQNSV